MSIQSINRGIASKIFGKVPLRIVLIVPFVILITVAVGLTGYLSFRNGQQAINDVASQLRGEITLRAEEYLFTTLELPHQLNQINKKALEDGLLDLTDYGAVQKYFWRQIQTFETVSYIQVGTENGVFIGAERQDNRLWMPWIENELITGNCAYYSDGQGNRTELAKCNEGYDPRLRPWYKLAVEDSQPVWTGIYQYSTTDLGVRLGTTAVLPVYDDQDDLLGVVGTDITLHGLGYFLDNLEAGKNGQTFIMERNGLLVASSTIEQAFTVNEQGESERILATAVDDRLVASTATMLQETFGGFDSIQDTRQFEFDLNGERQFGQVLSISDGRGLEWLFVVVIPEFDFMEQIQANNQTTILLIIIALIAATIVGILTARWITGPILALNSSAKALSKGQWQQTVILNHRDELSELANSFNSMAQQLHESFATLEASEKKYRTLFEDSKDAIFISNPSGQLIDINPAGLSLFGYGAEAIKTLNMKMLYVNPLERLQFQEIMAQQGMVKDFEITYRKKDGTVIDCLETATIRRAKDGTILNYQGIIRDITNYKQAEQERRRFSALQRELAIAQEIQQTLLPLEKPSWPDLDVICYSKPTQDVGGDFYAYHSFKQQDDPQPMDISRFALAVGDVSGKGIPAALLMAVSLASFQSSIIRDFTPSQLLAYLNHVIMSYTRTSKQNCAFVYVEISEVATHQDASPLAEATSAPDQTYRLKTANAGCMPPLLKRRNGQIEWIDVFGFPLGETLAIETGYREATVKLSTGDMIILTSDGVVEAQNALKDIWGFTCLEQAVASGPTDSAEAMLTHLKTEIETFVDIEGPHDDLTIVVIRL